MANPLDVLRHPWQADRALRRQIILIGLDQDAYLFREKNSAGEHEAGYKGYAAIIILFIVGLIIFIVGIQEGSLLISAFGGFFMLLSVIGMCGVHQGNTAAATIDRRTDRAYSYYCYDMRDQSVKCCIVDREFKKLIEAPGSSNLGYIEDIEKISLLKNPEGDNYVFVTFYKESGKVSKGNLFTFDLTKTKFHAILNRKIDELYEIGLENIQREYEKIYGAISDTEESEDSLESRKSTRSARAAQVAAQAERNNNNNNNRNTRHNHNNSHHNNNNRNNRTNLHASGRHVPQNSHMSHMSQHSNHSYRQHQPQRSGPYNSHNNGRPNKAHHNPQHSRASNQGGTRGNNNNDARMNRLHSQSQSGAGLGSRGRSFTGDSGYDSPAGSVHSHHSSRSHHSTRSGAPRGHPMNRGGGGSFRGQPRGGRGGRGVYRGGPRGGRGGRGMPRGRGMPQRGRGMVRGRGGSMPQRGRGGSFRGQPRGGSFRGQPRGRGAGMPQRGGGSFRGQPRGGGAGGGGNRGYPQQQRPQGYY